MRRLLPELLDIPLLLLGSHNSTHARSACLRHTGLAQGRLLSDAFLLSSSALIAILTALGYRLIKMSLLCYLPLLIFPAARLPLLLALLLLPTKSSSTPSLLQLLCTLLLSGKDSEVQNGVVVGEPRGVLQI